MSEVDTVAEDTRQEIERVGAADVIVGIPTHNHAETIAGVVRAAHTGLARYFPSLKAVVVNSDAGSTDGTPERALEAGSPEIPFLRLRHYIDPANKLITAYHGIPGRGDAFRTILASARKLGARACIILDADLRSTEPEWVQALAGPVLNDECDFVAPYYVRHKYDGTVNSGIVYPLMRALYGARVRNPVAADFGLSASLVNDCLNRDVWGTDVARLAIDMWLTTQVVCGRFRMCQAVLGTRLHGSRHTGVQLSDMLTQVIGALFTMAERYAGVWQRVRNSHPTPLLGEPPEATPEPVTLNVGRLLENFRLGAQSLQEVWGMVLTPATMLELRRLARQREEAFRCPDQLWARIIYDFVLGHHLRVIPRDHLLGALTPLYLGWLASFALETDQADAQQAEGRLEQLCLAFETQKPYLISRWRWPDRFSP